MRTRCIKDFMDSCHSAKKIVELMPSLPDGIKPRHIHVIDALYELSRTRDFVKVSDISEALNVTRPSITKLVMELEEKDVLSKNIYEKDSRIIILSLTQLGQLYYKIYVQEYYTHLQELFGTIEEEQLQATTEMIKKVYKMMISEVS